MMGARGLQILEDDRKQCRETLVNSFGLGLNVSMATQYNIGDLVEKSEVEARYREAVVRLGDIAKQDESYTGYFEREEDLK